MDDDPVAVYIREVYKFPPLADEEEAALRIQLTDPEVAENAKLRLAESHLRTVVSIAERQGDTGVHMLDLIQAGNRGPSRRREHLRRKSARNLPGPRHPTHRGGDGVTSQDALN